MVSISRQNTWVVVSAAILMIFILMLSLDVSAALYATLFAGSLFVSLFVGKELLPVILFVVVWYVPGLCDPGGVLAQFSILRWISYIIIPVIALFYFITDLAKGRFWDISFIGLPMLFILAVIIISSIHNKCNMKDFLSGILLYLRYPLLFLLFINWRIKDRSLEWIIPLFFVLLLLQIPEVFYRAFVMGFRGDRITYSLGAFGTYRLGIYCLYAAAITAASYSTTGIKWYHLILLILFPLVAAVGEIKALFLFLLPMLAVVMLMSRSQLYFRVLRFVAKRNRFAHILMIVPTSCAILYVYNNWDSLARGRVNQLGQVIDFLAGSFANVGSAELPYNVRIDQIEIVFRMLTDSFGSFFLGFGPGSALAGNFSGIPGKVASILSAQTFSNGSITQLGSTAGELGILGLMCFAFLFIRIFSFLKHCRCDPRIHNINKYWVYCNGTFGILMFYAVLGPWYLNVWRFDESNFLMYTFLAILYRAFILSPEKNLKTNR